MKYLIFLISLTLLGCKPVIKEQQFVILISFDGFRHDYIAQVNTPNIDSFINNGVASEALIPSFPSKTFPNHYSLVTGLYPAHHGIVDNNFYDPKRNALFKIKDRDKVHDEYYYFGDPLWTYARKFNLKSASFFWVGSEVNDTSKRPNYAKAYDEGIPNTERIDQVIKWLELPKEERPQFISLYFSMIDDNGHRFGPLSTQNKLAIQEADSLIGSLMSQLEKINLPVNVIITSDHGMRAIENKASNYIMLPDYYALANDVFITTNSGTHAQLYFSDTSLVDSVYASLKTFKNTFSVFRKGNFPTHWNYNEPNDRIGDLIISAPYGKNFITKALKKSKSPQIGAHGYDPKYADMHTIFYANGPSIKEGLKLPPLKNVDIYPFICEILAIPIPSNIDGDLETIGEAIKKP